MIEGRTTLSLLASTFGYNFVQDLAQTYWTIIINRICRGALGDQHNVGGIDRGIKLAMVKEIKSCTTNGLPYRVPVEV
jgi:hypothetical protein